MTWQGRIQWPGTIPSMSFRALRSKARNPPRRGTGRARTIAADSATVAPRGFLGAPWAPRNDIKVARPAPTPEDYMDDIFSLPKTYDFKAVEAKRYAWWEFAGLLRAARGCGAAALRDLDASAQRHRRAAPGPRHVRRHGRPDDAPCAHAGPARAVAPRQRPRRHRHPAPGREASAAHRGGHAGGARAGEIRRADVGMEEEVRRDHHRAAAPPGRLVRLVARALHPRRRPFARRARGFRPPVRKGPDLPRHLPDQLVPRPAHRRQRSGGRVQRGRGHALHLQVPA